MSGSKSFSMLIELQEQQLDTGAWVIRCAKLPGLLIAHANRETVWSDVQQGIKSIFREEFGMEVELIPLSDVPPRPDAPVKPVTLADHPPLWATIERREAA